MQNIEQGVHTKCETTHCHGKMDRPPYMFLFVQCNAILLFSTPISSKVHRNKQPKKIIIVVVIIINFIILPSTTFPSINIQWVKQNVMGYRVCVYMFFVHVLYSGYEDNPELYGRLMPLPSRDARELP